MFLSCYCTFSLLIKCNSCVNIFIRRNCDSQISRLKQFRINNIYFKLLCLKIHSTGYFRCEDEKREIHRQFICNTKVIILCDIFILETEGKGEKLEESFPIHIFPFLLYANRNGIISNRQYNFGKSFLTNLIHL